MFFSLFSPEIKYKAGKILFSFFVFPMNWKEISLGNNKYKVRIII